MLRSREGGTNIVSVAPGLPALRDADGLVQGQEHHGPGHGGKKIGSWLGGNEPELFAALTKAGIDPKTENVIQQNFDMTGCSMATSTSPRR